MIEVRSKSRSRSRKTLIHSAGMLNGFPTHVSLVQLMLTRASKLAPCARPYQSGLPFESTGPAQVAFATAAAASVMVTFSPVVEQLYTLPTAVVGSKSHWPGYEIMPSSTPSRESQASITASRTASSSQGLGYSPAHYLSAYNEICIRTKAGL